MKDTTHEKELRDLQEFSHDLQVFSICVSWDEPLVKIKKTFPVVDSIWGWWSGQDFVLWRSPRSPNFATILENLYDMFFLTWK